MTGRWVHIETEESERFVVHLPGGHKRSMQIPSTSWSAPIGVCVSRAGVRRARHEFDRDGVCVFCDKRGE